MPIAAVPYKDERPCPGETEELSALAACCKVIIECDKRIKKYDQDLAACHAFIDKQDKRIIELEREVNELRGLAGNAGE